MIQVFKRPAYLILAFAVASVSYVLIAWIPLTSFVLSVDLPTAMILLSSAPFDVHIADALYPAILSILVGINASMLLFYLKRYGLHAKAGLFYGARRQHRGSRYRGLVARERFCIPGGGSRASRIFNHQTLTFHHAAAHMPDR